MKRPFEKIGKAVEASRPVRDHRLRGDQIRQAARSLPDLNQVKTAFPDWSTYFSESDLVALSRAPKSNKSVGAGRVTSLDHQGNQPL